MGVLRDSPPVSYQVIAGARVPVESRYVLTDGGAEARYGFAVGAGYRPDHELIIDPGVEYSTFLGGSSHEIGAGIEVDAAGNAYVVGHDAVAQLSHDARRLQAEPARPATSWTSSSAS